MHPLIAEAVYADLALGARRLAHRRAAAILDRAGAADRVAAHLLATGPAGDAWVVERLSAAAEVAWKRGAAEVAASYLRRSADPPARMLVAIAHAAVRRGRSPDEAQQLIERVLAREPSPRPNASASIIVTLLGLEAFGTLQQLCDDMLKAARQRSAVQELMGIASFLAWASYRRGELADAEAQARWAVEHATGIWAIDALAHLVETLVERDELDEAAAELGRMAPPQTSHTVVVAAYLMGRGQLRMAQGQGNEALQDFLACGERCERLGVMDGIYNWRSAAAVTHAVLGNAAEARRLAREAVEVARGFGRPRALGVAVRAAGLAEGRWFAATSAGAIVTTVNPLCTEEEISRQLRQTGAERRVGGMAADEGLAHEDAVPAPCRPDSAAPLAGHLP